MAGGLSLLFLLLLCLWCTVGKTDNSPQRQTTTGTIRGLRKRVLGKDVDIFLGIPYAEPPVDDRRFQRPEMIKPWKGIIDAVNLPSACYQVRDTSFNEFPGVKMWNPNTNISEDCLYLNIWQPVGGSSGKAIMVWVFGGGFYSGSASLSIYEASHLAAEGDVVVMSMQYRLGPLGFLYLKGGSNAKDGALGNMGLLDQALAIHWLRDNAHLFGGSPDRITLFGESAGGDSVSLHLLSPLTQNLIQSSIMQSASAVAPWSCDTQERAHAGGLEISGLLGCESSGDAAKSLSSNERTRVLECLRDVSAEKITKTQWALTVEKDLVYTPFGPTVDNYFLTEMPKTAAIKDAINRKSIMLGVNNDEGMYFLIYLFHDLFPFNATVARKITKKEFSGALPGLFRADKKFVTDAIAFEYGVPQNFNEEVNYAKALDDIAGDYTFKCPVIDFGKIYAGAGKNVYLYQFNHITSANPWPVWAGVLHGYEIDHVFGLPLNTDLHYKQDEVLLSKKMVKYWTNFAKTGDPNKGEGGVQDVENIWPVYDLTTRQILLLNTSSINVQSGLLERKCEFWDKIYPKLHLVSEATCGSIGTMDISDVKITALLCLVLAILSKSGLL